MKFIHALPTNSWLRRLFVSFLIGILSIAMAACGNQTESISINGPIMGTQYQVTMVCNSDNSEEQWQALLLAEMDAVNQSMSTWISDSEISMFNQNNSTEFESASEALMDVLSISMDVSTQTDGAFDVTVMPLVNLWGFGPRSKKSDQLKHPEPPSDEELALVKETVGYTKLQISADASQWKKTHPNVNVDFSAVAKGYAVDKVSERLTDSGCEHHMVDIGGEVRVTGKNAEGNDWRIAIEKPDTINQFQAVIDVSDISIASSGDYRNFYMIDGKRYSHTIDPRTYKPIEHNLASVTVLDQEAAKADAFATAFMVMGNDAIDFAQENNIPAYFILRSVDQQNQSSGEFVVEYTDTFEKYIVR